MDSVKEKLLTPREENFCIKYTELNNASEAYRASYQVGENTLAATVNNSAYKVMKKGEIRARINALREANRLKCAVSVESITKEIESAEALAYETKKPSALVTAIMCKAKLHGLIGDKSKQKVEPSVNRDLRTLMAEIDGQSRTLQKRSKNDH